MSNIIADKAKGLVIPLAQDMGLEVVEVEFERENAQWFLRVYIDKRGGVRIEDCELLSKAFSTILDDVDIINRTYSLVVSSPGLDRPLKTEADYRRYEGALLDICMLPGRMKSSIREEHSSTAEDSEKPESGDSNKRATKKQPLIAKNKSTNKAGSVDIISGYLDKYEGGRIYLTDEQGVAFSIAGEDTKTVKRAIRFK